MAHLVVLKDGRPFLRFRLEKERTTIGRGNDVDLHVPDAHISRLHFLIENNEDEYRIVDRSTNGTFVNGVKTREAPLEDQDIIAAGGCEIRFERSQETEPVPTVCAPAEGGAISYDSRCERVLYSRPALYVRESCGAPMRIPISQDLIRIGSSRDNDVRLQEAEERHCQLLATMNGFTLRNLPSRKPVLLDDAPVNEDRPFPYGSVARVGSTTFQLVLEEGEDPIVPMNVPTFEGMIGTTEEMQKIFALIDRFSRHDASVIVLGETGTGKELVARALHRRGHRARGPFVAINCSAISPQLFESELFGHMKGAFTGAVQSRSGVIEAADGGVLFLDEIGDLPLELQPKLLRVLETSTVTPVGSMQPRPVSIRVVAATHKNLPRLVEEEKFRADLFYRLFVLTVELPPLRERFGDLQPLLYHFLEELCPHGIPRVTANAYAKLAGYDWPGNIRELRHVLVRALASNDGLELSEASLNFLGVGRAVKTEEHLRGSGAGMKLEEMEKAMICRAIRTFGNNRSEAARALGIARSTLHMKMKKYGLDVA